MMKQFFLGFTACLFLFGCSQEEDDPLKGFIPPVVDIPVEAEIKAPSTFEHFPAFQSRVDKLTEKQCKTLVAAANVIEARGGIIETNIWLCEKGDFQLGETRGVFAMLFFRSHRFEDTVVSDEFDWNDADLAVIRVLPNLRTLAILNGPFTDEALSYLRGRTDIESLNLSERDPIICSEQHPSGRCRCGGERYHGQHGFTAKALEHLSGLKNLKDLNVRRISLTDDSLRSLATLTKLVHLDLESTGITDAGLEHLAGLTNLQTLDLSGTHVTDAGLRHLAGLKNLHVLYLNDTEVTDSGMEHLEALEKLEYLYLKNSKVTRAGMEQLQKKLFPCKISR